MDDIRHLSRFLSPGPVRGPKGERGTRPVARATVGMRRVAIFYYNDLFTLVIKEV